VFVRIAAPHWYPLLSYIRMLCLYAVSIVDLCLHALQSLAGTHCCSTFAPAAYQPLLLLVTSIRASRLPSKLLTCVHLQSFFGTHCCPTFVRAARLPSTSSTCIDACCRTSSLHTAVLYSYILRICRLCHWLDLYMLLICHLHHRPVFACRASLVPTAILHSYALLVCHQNR